ncbi:hypothetical protein [Nocardioides sp. CFH 31398]|uniref:hypothetical protein n=1 Tax=Nocardioides sp. CFH 31398 TaxID=2919579 RepID=UPI001F058C89|nr:hypothetical protein [Nocardioides sp. CFH 31398]MCH1865346.1 hypothetical protein [Nocardioides sp. CFH 31398]
MNALIKQTLDERAADGPTPYVDVAAIESVGRQRVRRRRVASGVGALAVLAAVGVATPYVVNALGDGGDQGQVAVDGAAPTPVSWSTGSTVHLGDGVVELPSAPVAYVLSDDGIVWTDAQDGVNLTAGGRTSQLGVSTPDYGRVLASEGSLAAWYDGNEQAFTVVDTSTRELVRQVPVTLDGPQDGEFDGPSVRALDDGVLWFYADREVTGMDLETGDVQGFAARNSEDLADARAGHLVLDDRGANDRIVTTDGDEVGTVPGGGRVQLSPDARYVVTDTNDSEQVLDAATGADVTPAFDYDFQAVVGWLDTDRYQALALDVVETQDGEADGPIDFLVCSVSAGDCELVADDAVTPDDEAFALPVGESFG